jgi:hypothetical protein
MALLLQRSLFLQSSTTILGLTSFLVHAGWLKPSLSRVHFSSAMAAFKRAKLDEIVGPAVIGTHSGTFQADEAMGVWMLRQIPAYRQAKVVRTRDCEGMHVWLFV